ncbi:peptidoglycan-binding protein [Alteribacillus sp. HJP-4]
MTTLLSAALLFSPIASDAVAGDQTLKQGMKDADVSELQDWLKSNGYLEDQIDGIFGPLTEKALKTYQDAIGIGADGIAGPQTFGAISVSEAKVQAAPPSVKTEAVSRSLRQGMRGNDVRDLQMILENRGIYKSALDGVFGADTARAVRSYQQENGLQEDGIYGPQTFSALEIGVVKAAPENNNESQTQAADAAVNFSENVIDIARSYSGTPYHKNGDTPGGFDSGGFLHYVFAEAGKMIPADLSDMYVRTTPSDKPQPGDIVFFQQEEAVSHAGLFLGGGKFIHADERAGVTVSNLGDSNWGKKYMESGRI